jgi:hypothetical protein
VFLAVLWYFYYGEVELEDKDNNIEFLLKLLKFSDLYLLEEVKNQCEKSISELIHYSSDIELVRKEAEKYNAY